MSDKATCFSRLGLIFDLMESGRTNAALAEWRALPEDFRTAVFKMALFCIENSQTNPTVDASIDTPYGRFDVNPQSVNRMRTTVREIAVANSR